MANTLTYGSREWRQEQINRFDYTPDAILSGESEWLNHPCPECGKAALYQPARFWGTDAYHCAECGTNSHYDEITFDGC